MTQNDLMQQAFLGGSIWQVYPQQYAVPSMSNPFSYNRKFHRINKEVEISEQNIADGRFEEPLDELRIKVSKWLDN